MATKNALSVLATLAAAALFLASCGLLESVRANKRKPEGPAVFAHKIHVVDNAMDCGECHRGVRKAAEAGMPALADCTGCHEEPEAGGAIEAAIKELKRREAAKAPLWGARREYGDVAFHHAKHAGGALYELPSGQKKPLACEDCHGPVGGSAGAAASREIPMELCTDCHAHGRPALREGEDPVPAAVHNACSVCHAKTRSDRRPGDHAGSWRTRHAEGVRFDAGRGRPKRCGTCHAEDFCVACHQAEPPSTHNTFFRLKGHGIDAAVNRERCGTCHAQDFCERCHRAMQPTTHVGGWARGPYRHCLSCHFPLDVETTRCAVCHTGADHKSFAPPYPRDGNHGGNCTMACHTKPHPDPGPGCKECHK